MPRSRPSTCDVNKYLAHSPHLRCFYSVLSASHTSLRPSVHPKAKFQSGPGIPPSLAGATRAGAEFSCECALCLTCLPNDGSSEGSFSAGRDVWGPRAGVESSMEKPMAEHLKATIILQI